MALKDWRKVKNNKYLCVFKSKDGGEIDVWYNKPLKTWKLTLNHMNYYFPNSKIKKFVNVMEDYTVTTAYLPSKAFALKLAEEYMKHHSS